MFDDKKLIPIIKGVIPVGWVSDWVIAYGKVYKLTYWLQHKLRNGWNVSGQGFR